eukprot:2011825-Rhodomonas_salina.1
MHLTSSKPFSHYSLANTHLAPISTSSQPYAIQAPSHHSLAPDRKSRRRWPERGAGGEAA